MSEILVILTTVPGAAAGEELAERLVEERLAACVNVVPGLRSIYSWQGKVEREDEALLIAKVPADGFDAYAARVAVLHPYDVPEIVALPATRVSDAYRSWVIEQTRR